MFPHRRCESEEFIHNVRRNKATFRVLPIIELAIVLNGLKRTSHSLLLGYSLRPIIKGMLLTRICYSLWHHMQRYATFLCQIVLTLYANSRNIFVAKVKMGFRKQCNWITDSVNVVSIDKVVLDSRWWRHAQISPIITSSQSKIFWHNNIRLSWASFRALLAFVGWIHRLSFYVV